MGSTVSGRASSVIRGELRLVCSVLARRSMDGARTFSFAGSIAAVSWRIAHATSPGVALDVAVVADEDPPAARVIAVLTARVPMRGARSHVLIDRVHLATFRFVRPTRYPGLPDDVYRHVAVIPNEVVLDWRTHDVSVVLNLGTSADDGEPIARVETAFYASRMVASRPRLTMPSKTAPGS